MSTTTRAAHTPGPWTLHEQFDTYGKTEQRMYSVHAIWNSGPLNGVEFCGLARLPADRGDAELEANAQLIARAPDLRAFAELVARMLLDGETDDGHAYDPTAIDDRDTLESLIVKARELTGIEGPEKPVCDRFRDDGRGCCVGCGHFHGAEGVA